MGLEQFIDDIVIDLAQDSILISRDSKNYSISFFFSYPLLNSPVCYEIDGKEEKANFETLGENIHLSITHIQERLENNGDLNYICLPDQFNHFFSVLYSEHFFCNEIMKIIVMSPLCLPIPLF